MKPSAKLASTASGMTFEQWKRRPVYVVQCFTARIANELCGIRLLPGQGLALVFGAHGNHGLDTFRALRPYRSQAANALRTRVAAHVRTLRRQRDSQRAEVCNAHG